MLPLIAETLNPPTFKRAPRTHRMTPVHDFSVPQWKKIWSAKTTLALLKLHGKVNNHRARGETPARLAPFPGA
jgi:hypothetical protein